VQAMRAVLDLRAGGTAAYFTIDAGPHVKVLCAAADAERTRAALAGVPGVSRTLVAAPGPGAEVIA
jgi:diphosphomevalonate decarboxylase